MSSRHPAAADTQRTGSEDTGGTALPAPLLARPSSSPQCSALLRHRLAGLPLEGQGHHGFLSEPLLKHTCVHFAALQTATEVELWMRKVLNQLLAPCNSHVPPPSTSKRALAPGACLSLPSGSDGLFSQEIWDTAVSGWKLPLVACSQGSRGVQRW